MTFPAVAGFGFAFAHNAAWGGAPIAPGKEIAPMVTAEVHTTLKGRHVLEISAGVSTPVATITIVDRAYADLLAASINSATSSWRLQQGGPRNAKS